MARTASRHRGRRSSPAFYRDSTVRNEPLLAGFLVTGLALAGIGASTSTSLSLALALVGSLAGVLFVGLSTLVLHAMSTDEIRGRAGVEDRTNPPGQGGVCSHFGSVWVAVRGRWACGMRRRETGTGSLSG